MFSSRRFLAAFLIVMVLSAGFGLLPSSLVQSANACGSGCAEAIENWESAVFWAGLKCAFYGSDSGSCENAWDRAIAAFQHMQEVCDPGYEN